MMPGETLEKCMLINWNAYEREEDELIRQVNAGQISQKEFGRAMRDMRDEIRAYADTDREIRVLPHFR
jgi:predicted RNA-binding protein associated with RNAse of E/G family